MLSCPIRAIRSLVLFVDDAARVSPVCGRSWKCNPSAPIVVTACRQSTRGLKLPRLMAAPFGPVKTSASRPGPVYFLMCSSTSPRIADGRDTVRRPTRDLGGPRTMSWALDLGVGLAHANGASGKVNVPPLKSGASTVSAGSYGSEGQGPGSYNQRAIGQQ
jgi:hypothetical protein